MPTRSLSPKPGTALGLIALFFALGGSAFAVGERIHSPSVAQQRCTNGAVRGVAYVKGTSAGMANIPDQFTGAGNLFSRKFNCTGRAVQVRRVEAGVFEVRFVGVAACHRDVPRISLPCCSCLGVHYRCMDRTRGEPPACADSKSARVRRPW